MEEMDSSFFEHGSFTTVNTYHPTAAKFVVRDHGTATLITKTAKEPNVTRR